MVVVTCLLGRTRGGVGPFYQGITVFTVLWVCGSGAAGDLEDWSIYDVGALIC